MQNINITHTLINGVGCQVTYTPTNEIQREFKFDDGILIHEMISKEWYCNDQENCTHLKACKKYSEQSWNALLDMFQSYPELQEDKKKIDEIENHISMLEHDYSFNNGIGEDGIYTVYKNVIELQKIAQKHWLLMRYVGCVDVHLFC